MRASRPSFSLKEGRPWMGPRAREARGLVLGGEGEAGLREVGRGKEGRKERGRWWVIRR